MKRLLEKMAGLVIPAAIITGGVGDGGVLAERKS
jgi:hypothetical protein